MELDKGSLASKTEIDLLILIAENENLEVDITS